MIGGRRGKTHSIRIDLPLRCGAELLEPPRRTDLRDDHLVKARSRHDLNISAQSALLSQTAMRLCFGCVRVDALLCENVEP